MEPVHIQFEMCQRKYLEVEKTEEVYLEPFVELDEDKKKEGVEYISEFLSIKWGLDHSLLVDSKNRLFSTGFNRFGRLGHGDEKDRIKYT
jgi:alpha-tubulin suppressor-like RCC1 family protein